MHDGAVIIRGVQVVGVLSLEVVGRSRGNVPPVDPHVVISVAPGVFMLEAQGMEKFMLNDTMVNTAINRQRQVLLSTTSTQGRVAPFLTHNADIISLPSVRNKANSSVPVKCFHSFLDRSLFRSIEVIADGVWHLNQPVKGPWPFAGVTVAPAPHGVPLPWNSNISLH